jgi:broad specificity phosphatase PhoE
MKSLVARSGAVGIVLLLALACGLTALSRTSHRKSASPLQDATILIIRHAEKPEEGPQLSAEGQRRAEAYVEYFSHFQINTQTVRVDCLIAAADSKQSRRPRLTLRPLSKALDLKINTRFEDKDYDALAEDLRTEDHGKTILICWHHGSIPGLVQALGVDPWTLLPGGKWPQEQFGWVLQLRYDHNGRLIPQETRLIEQRRVPQDISTGR